jgi:hypothetical protein
LMVSLLDPLKSYCSDFLLLPLKLILLQTKLKSVSYFNLLLQVTLESTSLFYC